MKPLNKDKTNLLPYKMLELILIGLRKLNGAAVLPGDNSQVFQVKITLDPLNVMGKQIKRAFTLGFSSRMGRPVLPKPLFEKRNSEGPMPATQRSIDHGSFRVVEVCPMKEESLCVMRRKVSICTSSINVVTEDGKLFASGSYNHGSIC